MGLQLLEIVERVVRKKKPMHSTAEAAFEHIGLLFNEPPGTASLLFI